MLFHEALSAALADGKMTVKTLGGVKSLLIWARCWDLQMPGWVYYDGGDTGRGTHLCLDQGGIAVSVYPVS